MFYTNIITYLGLKVNAHFGEKMLFLQKSKVKCRIFL